MLRPCCFLFLFALGPVSASSLDARPNILLICVDDLKPAIGAYGDEFAVTPNLDRLARRGVLFSSAYCNQAVCAPSRNSLFTSLRPQSVGIYDLATFFRKATPDAVTLGQQFLAHGYRTEALGKVYHTGHGNQDDTLSWSVPHWRPDIPDYVLPESLAAVPPPPSNLRGPTTENAEVPDEAYIDGILAREAAARLEAAAENPGQPFLLVLGFVRPHLPFAAPRKYWDLYPSDRLPMPEVTAAPKGAPRYAGNPGGEMRKYSDIPREGGVDEATARRLIHGYYAATSYMDAQLGLVLDALDSSGLAENTIIVLWGDHGWHLGDHGFWCKHTNYEQAARIPLIIAAPGKPAGVQTEALVETVDIYPTLCELAGIPTPEGLDGLSFASVVADPSRPARDSVIHVYPRGGMMGRAIRTARHRLVEWRPIDSAKEGQKTEFELYDYKEDPLETRNLAASEPDLVADLRAILDTHPEPKPQWKGK